MLSPSPSLGRTASGLRNGARGMSDFHDNIAGSSRVDTRKTGAARWARPRLTRTATALLLALFFLSQPYAHRHESSGDIHSHDWDEHHATNEPHGPSSDSEFDHPPCSSVAQTQDQDATPLEIHAELPKPLKNPEPAADLALPLDPAPAIACLNSDTPAGWIDFAPEPRGPSASRAPPVSPA